LIEPTGVRNTKFVEAPRTATPSNAGQDPYSEFKRRYDEVRRAMAEMPLVTVDADTVARALQAKNPKPRYIIVGASGRASLLPDCC
jgi:hypothetical protein